MLESLARHYDFLKDVLRPPPVGPLADALAGMKETRAAPALVSHLFDPADTTNAISARRPRSNRWAPKPSYPSRKPSSRSIERWPLTTN